MASGTYGYRVTGGQGSRIQIEGLKETQKALRDMSDDLKDEMKPTHKAAAEVIVEGSKRYVPVRSGRLAASIRAVATRTSGRVRAGSAAVPYAGPIHFGWPARRIKPQPFIYDAMDARRQEVYDLYAQRIFGLIDKHGLDGTKIPASRLADPGRNIKPGTTFDYSADLLAAIKDIQAERSGALRVVA